MPKHLRLSMPRKFAQKFVLLGVFLLTGGCAQVSNVKQAATSDEAQSVSFSAAKDGNNHSANNALAKKSHGPITNLWQRIAVGFELPAEHDPRVDLAIRWYQQHPGHMDAISKRAEPYLFHIVTAVEQRGMPAEIALLPIIESAFRPSAYSSQGAAGLWQLMRPTAKRFGANSSWWYDGRRDVRVSTRAALNYLSYLHDYFDGDWLLALAAYNSGENRVRRAVAKNRELGLATDYWHLDLPSETQGYVPKLMALRRLLLDPEHFGIKLPVIANKASTRWVNIGQQLDLNVAAKLADTSIDDLRALNPGLIRWASDPDGPHYLLIRADQAPKFAMALRQIPQHERVSWRRHTVAQGDALSLIARTYGTTSEVIMNSNRLANDRIRIGQILLVPVGSQLAVASSTPPVDATTQAKSVTQLVRYRVKEGDNLWGISRRFGVPYKSLASWNAMRTDDALRVGKVLLVRLNGSEKQTRPAVEVSKKAQARATEATRGV